MIFFFFSYKGVIICDLLDDHTVINKSIGNYRSLKHTLRTGTRLIMMNLKPK